MSPEQIGALASHVHTVTKKYKDDTYFKRDSDEMEPWEKHLARLVNKDKKLPDYELIDNLVLDFLLSYFESEVHCQRENWNDDNEPVG